MSQEKLRPRLSTIIFQFAAVLVFIFCIRWFLYEPFTVPSGSMFPNLLINDYILVNKHKAGFRVPLTKYWITGPHLPKRGETMVFWSEKSQVYFVKRLMGLPGDLIKMKGHQIIEINGQPVTTENAPRIWEHLRSDFPVEDGRGVSAYIEDYSQVPDMGVKSAMLMFADSDQEEDHVYRVPEGQLFFMGDHRSASSDSRVWGFVSLQDLVGPVQYILFSCAHKSISTQFCDLTTIRWRRLFTRYNP